METGPEREVYGVCVHTTGNSVPEEALAKGEHPLLTARRTYSKLGLVGPHFCIAPDGTSEQYADPALVRYHVGLDPARRRAYLDGTWVDDRNRIDAATISWWKNRWPGVKSPSHLYPGPSANQVYIGIELIPAGVYVKLKGWQFGNVGHRPGFDKQRFSVEQYVALADLVTVLAKQFNLDLTRPGVLVGHEDLNPVERPGWDPGDANLTFSWNMLRGLLSAAKGDD